MDYAASIEDYTVTIGSEECTVIALTTNEIRCIPPDEQPNVGENFTDFKGIQVPAIQVCRLLTIKELFGQ